MKTRKNQRFFVSQKSSISAKIKNIWQMKNKNSIGHNKSLLNTLPQKIIVLVIAIALLSSFATASNVTVKAGDLYVDSNLGIGTTSPTENLDVEGNITTNSGGICVSSTTCTDLPSYGAQFGIKSDGGLKVSNGNSDFAHNLTISSGDLLVTNGDIGIGRIDPQARLHVNGEFFVGDRPATSNQTLEVYPGTGDVYVGSDTQDGDIYIKNTAGTKKVRLSSATSSYFIGGNLGIGTITPQATLQIGNSADAAKHVFIERGSLCVASTSVDCKEGNAGAIISSTSTTNLTIQAADASTITSSKTDIRLKPKEDIGSGKVYFNGQIRVVGGDDIITTTGSAGIGTTTLREKLTVGGNINASGWVAGSSWISNSPFVFSKDSEVGFTRFCVWDVNGYQNLIYWEGGEQVVETDSPVCRAKQEKNDARQECYDLNQLFDESDMSCYDYPEEEE